MTEIFKYIKTDDGYIAVSTNIKGAITEAKTLEELKKNCMDAYKSMLEVLNKVNEIQLLKVDKLQS